MRNHCKTKVCLKPIIFKWVLTTELICLQLALSCLSIHVMSWFNSYGWISPSRQDRVTRARFIYPQILKQAKYTYIVFEKMVLNTLDIRHRGTVVSEKWDESCAWSSWWPWECLQVMDLWEGNHVEPQWRCESHLVVSNSFWPHGLYSPWNSPGQNTGVSSCSLLQGTLPTQGLNPGLPHCRQIL